MSAQVDTALQYIRNDRVEAKIAGVMMLNKILSSTSVGTSAVIEKVYQTLPVALVIQMVQTETDEKSITVQLSGLNFLVYSCESPSTVKSVMKFVKELSEMFIRTQRREVKTQLGTFLKLLAMVNNRKGRAAIVAALLEAVGASKGTEGVQVLQLVTEIASTPDTPASSTTGKDSSIALSAQHSATLRSLIVQGVHGAAPQAIRDSTLWCVRDLLTGVPNLPSSPRADGSDNTSTYPLFPSWTWNKEESGRDPTHPLFLCSILRGELQLLCDEVLFLATHSAESVAERFNLTISAKATVPASMAPAAGATTTGTSTGASTTSTTTSHTSDSSGSANANTNANINTTEPTKPTDPAALQRKIDSDIAYFQSRITRTHAMYLTCLQLLRGVLALLIEDTVTGSGESAWGTLPGEMLLSIKKVIYSILNDLFEFLLDCAEHLKTLTSSTASDRSDTSGTSGGKSGAMNAFTDSGSLRSIACCTLDAMSPFLEQDPELMGVFAKCIPKLVHISLLSGEKSGEESSGKLSAEVKDIVVKALGASGTSSSDGGDTTQAWLDMLTYDPFNTTNATSSSSTTNNTTATFSEAVPSEILLHLLEPVRTLIYMTDSEGLDPNVCDQLVDSLPQLLPVVVTLVRYGCDVLNSTRGSGSGSAYSVNSTAYVRIVSSIELLLWLLKDLLAIQKGQLARNIAILMRGEGPGVLLTILGVDAQVWYDLAQVLRTTSAAVEDRMNSSVGSSSSDGSGNVEIQGLAAVSVEVAEIIRHLLQT